MTGPAAGGRGRIAALDAFYREDRARAAAVVFTDWSDAAATEEATVDLETAPAAYEPGALYRRELPALIAVLGRLAAPPGLLIVDAFAHLGPERRPGLGWRLWEALGEATPVIGVAKTPYHGAPDEAAVLRGDSARPLFVTAVGVDEAAARRWIAAMHGRRRLPTLLKRVDQLSRGA